MKSIRKLLPAIAIASICGAAHADTPYILEPQAFAMKWKAEVMANTGKGSLAPSYMASNRHGIITQGDNLLARAAAWKPMTTVSRFSYGFGIDMLGGVSSSTPYMRYNASEAKWGSVSRRPPYVWLQQLYGEVKFRGVFLTVGMKEHGSALLDQRLSSGDLVESGNSRPIPEVRAGFIDFQDIPFTRGWVQIQGEISYGKMMDNKWLRNHYNYYDYHLNQGALYTYKRCYFRTKPSMPLSVTVGMQVGAFFGGTTAYYDNGRLSRSETYSRSPRQFIKMLIPTDGGVDYYAGSSLGSWDIMFRYNFKNGYTLKAYLQKPFEDGSGIGFLNGFDGIWGLELKTGGKGLVTGAVVEYLDFTNQSGPLHWDYEDHPGSDLKGVAQGADNYYNNAAYNSYANYGMNIGSPVLRSPIYNTDGFPGVLHNLVRGFHAGVEGQIMPNLSYRLLGGYRRSWGTPFYPLTGSIHTTSAMLEGSYSVESVKGLDVGVQLAFDYGKLYGKNVGALVSVTYRGDLRF